MKLQLVYDANCANAPATRALLSEVLKALQLNTEIEEIVKGTAETPEFARDIPSPSVFVNGVDVVASVGGTGSSCRLYKTEGGKLSGIPPRSAIFAALSAVTDSSE